MAAQENIRIFIDGEPIDVTHRRLTGAQLRTSVSPPADNVWLDVADALDQPIAPTAVTAIEHNMRFFTDRSRTIYIDKSPFVVHTAVLTEAQLRALPTPPVPEDYGVWRDVVDDLDDPIGIGELVVVVDEDRFFSKPLPTRKTRVILNEQAITLAGARQTGMSIKAAAIEQGVSIKLDFLLLRKRGQKFSPVGDDEHVRVHEGDEFRANDGDDNS